jgi:hypothetical protein
VTIDLTRFSRFLTIAQQSTHDGEALNAFRFACRMLDSQRLTFTEYLNQIAVGHHRSHAHTQHTERDTRKNQQAQQDETPKYGAERHKQMLFRLLNDDGLILSDATVHFLESLSGSLVKWKRLTDRQGAALERVYKQKYSEAA